MNMFGEEAVVAGSTSALQRIATNTAWAAVMGPARAEDASTGVASRQERRARPSRSESRPARSRSLRSSRTVCGRARPDSVRPYAWRERLPAALPMGRSGTESGTRRTARSVPLFSMARGGRELAQCGIRIAVDLDEEMFGAGRFPIHLPAARAPNGIRTRAAALKGRCPRPLDDGGVAGFGRRGRHQPAVGTAPA